MTIKILALSGLLSLGIATLALAAEPTSAPAPADKKDGKKDDKGSDKPVEKKDDAGGGAPAGGDKK